MSEVAYERLSCGGTKVTKVNGRGQRRYVAYVDQHSLDHKQEPDVKLYSKFNVKWIAVRQSPRDLQAAIKWLMS